MKTLASLNIRSKKIRKTPPGASPGSIHIGDDALKSKIIVYCFSKDTYKEVEANNIGEIKKLMENSKDLTFWIDVRGFGGIEFLKDLSEYFSIHALELEDVINTYQRPKLEEYEQHLFIVSRMLSKNKDQLLNEQMSVFLGTNFLMTIQEKYEDFLEPVRERLRKGRGYIRVNGPEYLTYAVGDAIIDNYFPLLEKIGTRLDQLEEALFGSPKKELLEGIQQIKKELIIIRRVIWAERDKVNDMLRSTSSYISDNTKQFLRDTYDHCIQVIDIVDNYKEVTASMTDIYLSSVSNRMNQVIKLLAVISTIFIPLTFVAGIYGMNFAYEHPETGEKLPWNMPELYSPYGYIGVLLFMFIVAAIQLAIFYRKGWLDKT